MSVFYHFSFSSHVLFSDVADSLYLAVIAARTTHTQVQVNHYASNYLLEEEDRCCVINGSTCFGETIARILIAFLSQQFVDDAYHVERVDDDDDEDDLDGWGKPNRRVKH